MAQSLWTRMGPSYKSHHQGNGSVMMFHSTKSLTFFDFFDRDKRKEAYEKSKKDYIEREAQLWRNYQMVVAQNSQRRLEAARGAQQEQEERTRIAAQEAAVRQELLKRIENSPKDELGEEYFKDHKRFDKFRDERDPLYDGLKDKATDDWRQLLKEKLEETKSNYQHMKESQPFTYTGPTTEGGRFGYRTVTVENTIVWAILAVFVLLLGYNLWHTYQQNVRE